MSDDGGANRNAVRDRVSMRDVSVTYPTRDRFVNQVEGALDRVSLELRGGEMHALVGESGAGKSTVIALLTGLLPRGTTVCGHVSVCGIDVSHHLTEAHHDTWRQLRGRQISVIPQSGATFLTPVRTVGSQLRETIAALGVSVNPAGLLERAGLSEDVMYAYPHELSGGMATRVACAFALVGDPWLVLADEPTAGLDSSAKDAVLSMFQDAVDRGAAVLLVTHDLESAIERDAVDVVTTLHSGRAVHSEAQFG